MWADVCCAPKATNDAAPAFETVNSTSRGALRIKAGAGERASAIIEVLPTDEGIAAALAHAFVINFICVFLRRWSLSRRGAMCTKLMAVDQTRS